MTHAIPRWFAKESSFLQSSTPRHEWMCDQLLERRKLQAQPSSVLDALRSHLATIVGSDLIPTRVFEILSDGLGYLEPNWHAVEYSDVWRDGSSKLDVAQLRAEIKRLRNERAGELGEVKTQRAIGGRLYESGLFLVTPQTSYYFDAHTWQQVCGSNLPLKFHVDAAVRDAAKECTDIDASLIALSNKVLWPGYFKDDPGHYFSLVFLHASLWQSASGVWAFHVKCEKPFDMAAMADRKREGNGWQDALRRLVEPAVHCLEDVVGWASEHEGTQARRRSNVDLFFRATARERPTWTADGVHGIFSATDRDVYEITPSPAGAEDVRQIFDLAINTVTGQSEVSRPTSTADVATHSIMRTLEALFIAGRLEEQLVGSATTSSRLLPSLPDILRRYAFEERNTARPGSPADLHPETIALATADAISRLAHDGWKRWCAVALRVTCLAGFGGEILREHATNSPEPDEFLQLLTAVRQAS